MRHMPSSTHAKATWVSRRGLRALGMIGLRMVACTPLGKQLSDLLSVSMRSGRKDTQKEREIWLSTPRIKPSKEPWETRLPTRNLVANTAKQS